MAFNKRLWKGRQGTGLNKFSINGATPVPVVNQPDSVTEQGDALSAGNLNDLEDRIYDAFDDIADGTQIVGKATADASGNVITTTYETKADASDLKSAITVIDHRVQNLEQAKGSYVVSNYKDGSITPSGKGAWAVVEGMRGVSRVENNLVKTPTEGGVYAYSSAGSVSYSGDTIINTAGSNIAIDICNQRYQSPLTFQQNHTYLLSFDANVSESVALKLYLKYNLYKTSEALSANKWTKVSVVATWTSATEGNNFFDIITQSAVSQGATLSIKDIVFTDLNVYFGTSDLSFLGATDSAKLATIQTNYPHLLIPSDYGTRIVDSSYSGVRAYSINIWDEEWEYGLLNATTGQPEDSSSRVRSKNFIPVTAQTAYYGYFGSISQTNWALMFCYDANKNFLGYVSSGFANASCTTLANTAFIKFYYVSSQSYANDIQICLNSAPDKTTYHPYGAIDTLSLSFQGKSAGSVYDSCEPNVEVGGVAKKRETTRVNSKNLGNIDWSADGGYGTASTTFSAWLEDSKNYTSAQLADALCSVYKVVTNDMLYTTDVPCLSIVGAGSYQRIRVNDPSKSGKTGAQFKADMSGVLLYYALATESVTLSDPIIDNTLLTESGGRMATVQTGTVVDGSFDMGFINL